MNISDPYVQTIGISVVIIISYLFNVVSEKTKIPSVLLLIGLGIGIHELLKSMDMALNDEIMGVLKLLGIVGLIMIVLEAALDLKLTKEKQPIMLKSFFVALLSLVGTALGIAYMFQLTVFDSFYDALLYAIPLSILSSAIIIPSVGSLLEQKKEFMILESTFSDILGIMFFFFLIGEAETEKTGEIVWTVTSNIALTIVVSLVVSYLMVLLLQRLKSQVKLFFLIAVLVLLYSIGKKLHLSSLLIIMVFGLVLHNYKLFFRGKLKKLVKPEALDHITEDFHVVTMEAAFVVRTFFFVIFGMTLDFSGIGDINALSMAGGVLVITYVLRLIFLKLFVGKSITPQLWIAPRGLITVLLFFSIPVQYNNPDFNPTILLVVILATSFIMTGGLIAKKEDFEVTEDLSFKDWEKLDAEIEALKQKESIHE